jgi:alkyl hydroperoxide reductase subunit F
VEKFRYQLIHSHYIDHLMRQVEKIEQKKNEFFVTTSELKQYRAKSLIIATGMARRKLGVEGEEKFQRKGIFYGNIQDISFVQNWDVAVVGGGNSALQTVQNLEAIAEKIHLVSDSPLVADPVEVEKLNKIEEFKKYEGYKLIKIEGQDALCSIKIRKMASQETIDLPVKGVFVAIGLKPNSELISHLTAVNLKGEVIINSDCSTSCPGVFAAGDVTDCFGKRIIIASGEGAKAAMAARQYLLKRGKTPS